MSRLRAYLAWRDVRAKVRESDADDGPDLVEHEAEHSLEAARVRVGLPWDLATVFGEHLPAPDPDADAFAANEASLRAVDELTRAMTREQYAHYAECRAASFSHRKAKRFREFLNLSLHLEGNPSDEALDALSFLGTALVALLVASARSHPRSTLPTPPTLPSTPAPQKRRAASPLLEPSSLFSLPVEDTIPAGLATPAEGAPGEVVEPPLRVEDVAAGYVRRQQASAALKSGGMRNWRGGVKRVKVGFF